MNLHFLFIGTLAGYALLQWWLLPQAEAAWAGNGSWEKIAKVGMLAALKSVRTLLQLAVVAYGGLIVAIWVADILGNGITAASLHAKVDMLRRLKEPLAWIKDSIGANVAFWGALLGLAYLVYRRHRAELTAQFVARVNAEIERLNGALERGDWEELEPSAEMQRVRAQFVQLKMLSESAASEERKRLADLCTALETRWIELDFRRRMDLANSPPCETSLLRRLWPRMVTLLISKGFVRDTGIIAKSCSNAATVIMWLSLVGISSAAMMSNLEQSLAHAWDLAVAADEKEARESWDRVRQAEPPDIDPSPQPPNPQLMRQIARGFIRAYLSSSPWQQERVLIEREQAMKAAVLRQHITAGQGRLKVASTSPVADDALIAVIRDAVLDPERPTKLEVHAAERLTSDLSGPHSALLEKFNSKIKAYAGAYEELAEPSELIKALLDQILDPAIDVLKPIEGNAAITELGKAGSKGLKAALRRSIETQFDRFLVDLAGESSFADALVRVAHTVPDDIALTQAERSRFGDLTKIVNGKREEIAKNIQERHPAIIRAERVPGDPKEIMRLTAKIDDALHPNRTKGRLNILAGYEDLFASSKATAAATQRAEILAASGHALKDEEIAAAISLARDYDKLASSNLVGGILLGRSPDPHDTAVLKGVALRWQPAPEGKLTLILADGSGQETRLGPFRPDLIHRALQFAADGRPLVVTVINTGLGSVQKVLLHPALVDTEIGCEMIELDHFVFSYVDPALRQKDENEMERVRRFHDAYMFAFRYAAYAVATETLRSKFKAELKQMDRAGVKAALSDPDLFGSAKISPLAANYRIYSSPLLAAMRACLQKPDPVLEDFASCIELLATPDMVGVQTVGTSPTMPKPLEIASGVRDWAYSIDGTFSFLKHDQNDGRLPLEFLIQDTDPAGRVGVWSFQSLAPGIEQGVARLAKDPVAGKILVDAADFSNLQRLFRMIFDGRLLGPTLAHAVAVLAEELHPQIHDQVSTLRWEHSLASPTPQEAKFIAATVSNPKLRTQNAPLVIWSALDRLEKCSQTVAQSAMRGINDEAWRTNCALEDMLQPLAEICGAPQPQNGGKEACELLWVADFLHTKLAEIKLANMLGVSTGPWAAPDRPRLCRPKP